MSLRAAYPSLAALFDDELSGLAERWRSVAGEIRSHASGLSGDEKWHAKQTAHIYEECAKELERLLKRTKS